MATRNIKERLDELGQRLGAADFRAGEGLMNEANIRIFSYAPEEEMAVRHFIDLVNDNPGIYKGVKAFNLFDVYFCESISLYFKDTRSSIFFRRSFLSKPWLSSIRLISFSNL